MKNSFILSLQILSVFLLIALISGLSFAIDAEHPIVPRLDTEMGPFPSYYPGDNYQTLDIISLNSWSDTIRDHTGLPHRYGNLVQVIADGGNRIQDPPNPDGSPGGDDTLAYGNFNLLRIAGIQEFSLDSTKRVGLFYSQKFFIPYVRGKSYYLRLWEGSSEKTAPYYQDTIEYSTGADNGGPMLRMNAASPQPPVEADFKFGKPKLRPVKSK